MKTTKPFTLPAFDKHKLYAHISDCVSKAQDNTIGLVIDLFCGAGGTTEGIEQALDPDGNKAYVVIAGINHDMKAIYSEWKNHPLAYFSVEDIRTAHLVPIKEMLDEIKSRFPQCPVILWASLECTNHSNAKGGMSRDADSRTQPWELYRYIECFNPDGIWIENVKEFGEWGPLMEKVIVEKQYGAKKKKTVLPLPIPQDHAEQYFSELAKNGSISYCQLEVSKNGNKRKGKQKGVFPCYVPVKELKGTYYKPWLKKVDAYGYHHVEMKLNAADYGVAQSRERLIIIFAKHGTDISKPLATHAKPNKASNHLAPHRPIKECLDFSDQGESIFKPGKIRSPKSLERIYKGLLKFVATDKKSQFIDVIYGNGFPSSIEQASPTVRTKDGLKLVSIEPIHFINSQYTNGNHNTSIDAICPALTTNPKQSIVTVIPFSDKKDTGSNHFIINPSYIAGNMTSIDNPSPVVIASQHKTPLQMASVTQIQEIADQTIGIPIYEGDAPIMVKIKRFMAEYGIVDIKIRMLKVKELLKIQSFREDYYLAGGSTDQKRFIGNAVPPKMAKAIAEAQRPNFTKSSQIKKAA